RCPVAKVTCRALEVRPPDAPWRSGSGAPRGRPPAAGRGRPLSAPGHAPPRSWRVGAMRTSTARKLAVALLAAAGWLSVAAGPAGAQQVEFELRHSQQVVAGAWNPVRLVLRDQRDVLLEIRLDQGSLQTGERVVTYRAPLAGGSGLSSFEDDLFVPAWRSLTWTVRAGGRTLASGALNP